jgi:hypothetical protein
MMNSNERLEGDKPTESQTDVVSTHERDNGRTTQDQKSLSTSELLDRQQGDANETEEPLVSDAGGLNERW